MNQKETENILNIRVEYIKQMHKQCWGEDINTNGTTSMMDYIGQMTYSQNNFQKRNVRSLFLFMFQSTVYIYEKEYRKLFIS